MVAKQYSSSSPLFQVDDTSSSSLIPEASPSPALHPTTKSILLVKAPRMSSNNMIGSKRRLRIRGRCTNKTTRFEEADNFYYEPLSYYPYVATHEVWYTRDELQLMKKSVLELATELAKVDKKIEQKFKVNSSSNNTCTRNSYLSVVQDAYHACCAVSCETLVADFPATYPHAKRLYVCLQLSTTRLGLEFTSVRRLLVCRQERKKDLVARIRQLQTLFVDDHDGRVHALRMASEHLSRPARLFAQLVAAAAVAPHPCSSATPSCWTTQTTAPQA